VDRFLIEPGNLTDEFDAAVAIALGFEGGIPSALLLIKPVHEHIDLVMDGPLRGLADGSISGFILAGRARTLMDLGHGSWQDGFSWKNSMSCRSVQMRSLFLDAP
jgi:hypothetical protein